MVTAFTDNDVIPFGKHAGQKLGDLPAGYLLWLADSDNTKTTLGIYLYVKQHRVELEKIAAEEKEKFVAEKKKAQPKRFAGDDGDLF